eukprot:TRINITY_DN31017_c0_g1_i1.p1 TRINITY_DN31017_c0_g1~~TRINITY_DN31017_c0_g1_i1.p1  ORF type:complete len:678 (-),score=110.13 TRINITY_DN31017_c0_g1_i1:44-2077(-)
MRRTRRATTFWSTKVAIPEFIVGGEYEHVEIEGEVDAPIAPRATVDPRTLALSGVRAAGPLNFVESDWFQIVVGVVIVCNLIIASQRLIIRSSRRHADKDLLGAEDTAELLILLFYIVEMLLRMLHFGRRFVCPISAEVMWNYVDVAIVTVGALDQFLAFSQSGLTALRAFRAMRLLRVVRVVSSVSTDQFAWVDGPRFQVVGAGVIFLNALVMGVETENKNSINWWIDQFCLFFFLLELVARIRRARLIRYFCGPADEESSLFWNYLDTVIVVTGVTDQWLLPSFAVETGDLGHLMTLLRLLRLMRLLRLLRLVKSIRPLYQLALGIIKALQSMFWVLVLTMVALYACALIMTNLIGHGMIIGHDELDEQTRAHFGNVMESLFTLFGLMNSQFWREVEPLFDKLPWMRVVWVCFTVLSSWALLSVMTGVVSDNMLEVRLLQARKDEEKAQQLRFVVTQTLSEVFGAASTSGILTKQAYVEIISSPYYLRKLQQVANVPTEDLVRMFDWLDVDNKGSITEEDFMAGFDWLNEPVTGKSLLKLQTSVRQRCKKLEDRVRVLREEMDSCSESMATKTQEAADFLQGILLKYEAKSQQLRQERQEAEQQQRDLTTQMESTRRKMETAYHRRSSGSMLAVQGEPEAADSARKWTSRLSSPSSALASAARRLSSPFRGRRDR